MADTLVNTILMPEMTSRMGTTTSDSPAVSEEVPTVAAQESRKVEARKVESGSGSSATASLSKQWASTFGDFSSSSSVVGESLQAVASAGNLSGSGSKHTSPARGSSPLFPAATDAESTTEKSSISKTAASSSSTDLLWGTEEEANPYRDEIVRTIFGDVGAIRRDFSCAIERKILLHGRLYVTDRFICFYSNLFGFEKKIKIPYSYITCITKEYTAVFIPNAIAVITARKEYIFRSFWDRDECYEVLKQMHDMYRGVVETGPGAHIEEGDNIGMGVSVTTAPTDLAEAAESQKLAADRRRSEAAADDFGHLLGGAERAKSQKRLQAKPDGAAGGGSGGGTQLRAAAAKGGLSAEAGERQQHATNSTSLLDGAAAGGAAARLSQTSSRVAPSAKSLGRKPSKGRVFSSSGQADSSPKPASSTTLAAAASSTLRTDAVPAPPSPATTGRMTSSESAGSLISLANITALGGLAHELTSASFPVTIDRFFEHFLADDAPFSLAKFHAFQGDQEVSVTPWAETYRTERESEHTRELRFKRRLSSPIGPAATRTTKMQRCRAFGQRGIIMNTVMSMEDIPYRDCFTIEDRWVAEPSVSDKTHTRVRFEFQVAWTKSTIWKRRIEASSKADLEAFYNAYVHAATAYLESLEVELTRDAAAPSNDDESVVSSRRWDADAADKASVLAHRAEDDHTAVQALFHSVFVVYRVPWLVVTLVFLVVVLVKQHIALVENFKLQQQLLAELAALRSDIACRAD